MVHTILRNIRAIRTKFCHAMPLIWNRDTILAAWQEWNWSIKQRCTSRCTASFNPWSLFNLFLLFEADKIPHSRGSSQANLFDPCKSTFHQSDANRRCLPNLLGWCHLKIINFMFFPHISVWGSCFLVATRASSSSFSSSFSSSLPPPPAPSPHLLHHTKHLTSHHLIISSSHRLIISSSHHYLISSLSHLIIASSHHHLIISSSSHHLIISSSHHHLISSSSHHLIIIISSLSHHLIISSSHHLIISSRSIQSL